MKKEFSTKPEVFDEKYLKCCGNMSWYDFVVALPQLVFLVTGWKSNKKENACLHSWSSFVGCGANEFMCIMNKVSKRGHMYQSLKETGVCVLNFPSYDIYDRCIRTIGNNDYEANEITIAGLTAEKAAKVDAPRIKECHLNIECELLWEHELYEGSDEMTVALRTVNICIDAERYNESKLGRYGKTGYLLQVDQPTNPKTGEKAPIAAGTFEPSDPIQWITK